MSEQGNLSNKKKQILSSANDKVSHDKKTHDKKTYDNKRSHYLLNTLELNHDPFRYAVSERDHDVHQEDPFVFKYFVDPFHTTRKFKKTTYIDHLRKADSFITYGEAGSGKTAVKNMLEYVYRANPDDTLAVSVNIKKEPANYADPETFWRRISHELAVDLFIQMTEQQYRLPNLKNKALLKELADYFSLCIRDFSTKLEEGRQSKAHPLTGVSKWWTLWQRPVVQYTPETNQLEGLLLKLLEESSITDFSFRKEDFLKGLELAEAVGFKKVDILVDIVDIPDVTGPTSNSRNQQALVDLFERFYREHSDFYPIIPLGYKLFLPLGMKSERLRALTPKFENAIIKWKDKELLREIVARRFHSAAGNWIKSFGMIASRDVSPYIDDRLIDLAKESPRRLLKLASSMIDVHAERDPNDPIITYSDLEEAMKLQSIYLTNQDPNPWQRND